MITQNAVNNEVLTQTQPVQTARILKCKPGQGKFNRLIKQSQAVIVENGHAKASFKRDYTTGVATYVCQHCQASVQVQVGKGYGENTVGGVALTQKCNR